MLLPLYMATEGSDRTGNSRDNRSMKVFSKEMDRIPDPSRRVPKALPNSCPAGFSLVELLLVVSIIGIIASLAIPSLIESTKAANEANAIAYMRNWTTAQELYKNLKGVYADADEQLTNLGLIGKGSSDSHGYTFSLDNPPGSQYTWWGRAWPNTPGGTGYRYFFIDNTGVIRWSTTGQADANDPPL